jgi:hypothetical protein
LANPRGRERVRILVAGVVLLVMLEGMGCSEESPEKDDLVKSPQVTK